MPKSALLPREHAPIPFSLPALRIAAVAVFVAFTAMLSAPMRAHAQPVIDTTGFVTRVVVGAFDCVGCPPRICPGEPLPVTIAGVLPSTCITFRGAQLLPTQGPLPVIAVDFDVVPCATPCARVARPFQQQVQLGRYQPGTGQFIVIQRVRDCADSTQFAYVNRRIVSFDVPDVCPAPEPIDSLVRGFTRLAVVPESPCVNDSVQLRISENGCPPCVSIRSFEFVPARDAWVATLDWTPACAEFNCDSDTLRVPVPSGAAGDFALRVLTDVVVHSASDARTFTFERVVQYRVRPTCEPPAGCLDPRLPPSLPQLPECSLLLAPGETGELVIPVQSSIPVAGVEGQLFVGGAFHVVGVSYAGPASGAVVSWQREGKGARFLVFGGATSAIVVGEHSLLRVRVQADSSATLEATGTLHGVITLASDEQGEAAPICFTAAVPATPSVMYVLCRRPLQAECDVNGDGRSDIRDLVRMVGCLRRLEGDTTRTGECRDCDGDGLFQLDDVFCCAQRILRGAGLPGDSARVREGLTVTMDPAEDAGSVHRVRIHVRGASALGAALLRVSYPADRWRAVAPPLTADPIVPTGWLPIDDLGEPGMARIGLLRLEPTATDDVTYTLLLQPVEGAPAGGEVRVQGADLTLPDGGMVAPAAPLPAGPLAGGLSPLEVALSPARPNPSGAATSFVVTLMRPAQAELVILDLAGRQVATLAQGPLGAGAHTFVWDGSGARDGVYFARLSVGGRVHTSRVALLKQRH